MQQQPNAPPLPPTRLPMRYPNRPRRHLNVGGVLGGNGYYPNIEANGYYPNTGGNGFIPNIASNGFYPNTRSYGYFPPFQNSNYNYPMIDRPRIYRRNIFYNRNYLPQQPYYYYNQPPGAVVMPRGRFYHQQGQRRGSSSRLRTQSNRRRSRSDQRQSRSRQRQRRRRRRPRQLRLNDFMPPQLRDTSSTTTTVNLPNQFNLGEMAATSATIAAPLEALPQRERFRFNNVTQPFTVDQN